MVTTCMKCITAILKPVPTGYKIPLVQKALAYLEGARCMPENKSQNGLLSAIKHTKSKKNYIHIRRSAIAMFI